MIDPPDITYYGNEEEFEHPLSNTLNDENSDPPVLSLAFLQDSQPLNVSGVSIDTPNVSIASDGFQKKNTRSFMKRSCYKRRQNKLNRRVLPSLVNNFSNLTLDENTESLLNKSLSFVPTPKRMDKTNIETIMA